MHLKEINLVLAYVLVIFSSSCSFSKLASESNIPKLTESKLKEVDGRYRYADSALDLPRNTIFEHFSNDTLPRKKEYVFLLKTISQKKIQVDFLVADSLKRSLTFKGKMKNGFFKSRTKLTTVFPLGIIVWAVRNESVYFGLTNEKNLLVINKSGALALLIAMPLSGSGGEQKAVLMRQ